MNSRPGLRVLYSVLPLIASLLTSAPLSALPADVMPLSQVRAGMKGYGLTVFRGTRIERFAVEVVSVVRRGSLVAPGHDMILVRMSGGPITDRKANLIRGMSGSPVYMNGKVIGAFAMGEPNSIEPLGGVTPIEDMLEAWDPRLPQSPWITGLPATIVLPSPLRIGHRTISRLVRTAGGARAVPQPGDLALQPCTTVLSVSGAPPQARARFAEALKPLGVEVVQGPASGSSRGLRGGSLQPGAAFGMMLVTGDVTSGATGTVTYRQGARFLGFGHPLMGLGPVSAPICTAYIHDIYPLQAGSYKISSPGPVVGASDQDRPFCVSGSAGASARVVPVSVEVLDETTGRTRTFRARCADHPSLLAANMLLVAGSAVYDVRSFPGPCMADVETRIETEGLGALARRNTYYDRTGIDAVVTGDLEDMLVALTANPFRRVPVRSAALKVTLRNGRATAVVERAFVRSTRVEPGKEIEVGVVIKPYGAASITRVVRVPVPASATSGRVAVEVRGGGASPMTSFAGLSLRSGGSQPTDLAPPATAEQVVERVIKRETGKEVVVRVLFPTTSVAVDGEALRDLPPYLEAGLRSPRVSAPAVERVVARVVVPVDWVTTGSQSVSTSVVGPQDASPTPAAAPGLPPASPSAAGGDFTSFSAPQGTQAKPRPRSSSSATGPSPAPGAASTAGAVAAAAAPTPPVPSKPDATVVRVARTWRETGKQAALRGELHDIAATEAGLVLTSDAIRGAELSAAFAWCAMAQSDGSVLVGTGPDGAIRRVGGDERVATVATLPEHHVSCLCSLPDGVVIAGTLQSGRLYMVAAAGTPSLIHQFAEPHILACLVDGAGRLVVGTGGAGAALYRRESGDTWRELLRTTDRGISALASMPDGTVVAGTSGRGVLYRVAPDGATTPFADLPDATVSSLVVTRTGSLMAGTAPKGLLLAVQADGSSTTLAEYPSSRGLLLARDATGGISAVSGAVCLEMEGAGPRLCGNPDGAEFVAAARGMEGRLFAVTSSDAILYRVGAAAGAGVMTSGVLDAAVRSRWGVASFSSDAPTGAGVEFAARSGETPVPDGSWSAWCPVAASAAGRPLGVPPARFLQYRLKLARGTTGRGPCVRSVSITYLPANQPPRVSFQSPMGGEAWSGRQELKWSATDPDRDALSYEVAVSRDGGATWTSVTNMGGAATVAQPATETTRPGKDALKPAMPAAVVAQGLEQVKAELSLHPDMPAALRDAILARARDLQAKLAQPSAPLPAQSPSAAAAAGARSNSRSIDTQALPDGPAIFRVIASDRPANGDGALTAEARSEPVTLCNSSPVLYLIASTVKVQKDRSVLMDAVAVQTGTFISAIQFRVDGGEWSAARPASGIFAGALERAVVETSPLTPGKHRVEVRAYNAAGLADTDGVDVTVP